MPTRPWWRDAVIYQVYPRSFCDANGDGVGDLPGITGRLPALADLGVDGVWISPFYTSPQHDHGYDVADYCDVDPLFGTLDDAQTLIDRAHELGLRIVVDLVPNHTSSEHPWFQAALASPPGSPERARYFFRDGRGPDGALPPNNWRSAFGGSAWTRVVEQDGPPGQWYLHLFASTQPDLDWTNPRVRADFLGIFRFWLDRGVDGFRIDVAHGMVKHAGLPDYTPPANGSGLASADDDPPMWAQPEVHEIVREWRALVESYPGDRLLCAEAWVSPLSALARWTRPGEMQHAFNFVYMATPWNADALRAVISESIDLFGAGVGVPTWVLSNHDVVRHTTRLAVPDPGPMGAGIGPRTPGRKYNPATGLRRARAATLVMLALPGSSYLYQGEELGLPEVIELPDEARRDPSWTSSRGELYGRDGCRVPIPWEADAPNHGFGPGERSWLPQPAAWADLARDRQSGVAGSTLELYREALALRRELGLGLRSLTWRHAPDGVLSFTVGDVVVVANTGHTPVPLPHGEVILASCAANELTSWLPASATVWLRQRPAP